jgi:hypothetical protein
MQRLRNLNSQYAEKAKNYTPKPIVPSPLTLIKPFNLSSNNSKMLMKKRTTTGNIEEINNKITEAMKKKCEGVDEIKESVFSKENTMKLLKTPPEIKYMKKSLGRSVSRSHSRSPIKSPLKNEDDLNNLSSRIEKYCTISGINVPKNSYKSPIKICHGSKKDNEDKVFNLHMNNIFNNDLLNNSYLNTSTHCSTSIRKHFGNQNLTSDEKIRKDMQNYKFKAKALNKNIFAPVTNVVVRKQPEIESFESILSKTRQEKQSIDKFEKDAKKANKMNIIKHSRFNQVNKENVSRNINFSGERMLIE